MANTVAPSIRQQSPRRLFWSLSAAGLQALLLPAALATGTQSSPAQPAPALLASEAMACSVMAAWPAGVVATTGHPGQLGYEEGVLLDGLAAEWRQSHNPAELAYIQSAVDRYVTPDGTLQRSPEGAPYPSAEHTLDDVEIGRSIVFLYLVTHGEKYAKAADFLHGQLAAQPRTASGGYWHKQIYPNQIWLDGAYMAEPFRAAYAATFDRPQDFDDIARQFLLMDEHMRDPRTGLLRHGWDESKAMPWADKQTGLSPEVWARAMGWYAMALVDTLDWFPPNHPQRATLVAILNRTIAALLPFQDPATGLWWQVLDRPGAQGNYLEASASEMFVYALAKGARLGYLPQADRIPALKGWTGIQRRFVQPDPTPGAPADAVRLTGTVKVGGLGGKPYRSGTYDYYIHEPTGDNDAKGIGAYLLAGSEIAQIPAPRP